jgi:uncharacterized protein
MKNVLIMSILIGLFHGIYIYSQDILEDNGYNKIYYPNGKVSSEGYMKNGKPEGYWKTYYPTGVLKSEGNRRNHLLDSTWNFYNELGDTLQKVNYIMGKRNGYTIEYFGASLKDPMNKGKIKSRELYINDKKEGLSIYYHPNGQIKEEVQYLSNKRNGLSKEFEEKGNVITIMNYINGILTEREKVNRSDEKGLKQGIWRTYYNNGKIKSETNYKDNLLDGPFKEYDENGNISLILHYTKGNIVEEKDTSALDIVISNKYDSLGRLIFSGSYRNNIPVGIHRIYDETGKVISGYIYNNYGAMLGKGIIDNEGKKEGVWTYFDEQGNIKSNGTYVNNLEQGMWKFFFVNGKTEQTGVYKNGKADGAWKWFFNNGSIKREEEYYNGKEEGTYTEYDTTGELIASGTYFDGQKEGEWFYKVGDYAEKGKFIGDLKDGKWQAFYSNGKLKYEGNYIQGNPDGEHVFYYNNGKVKEINYYVMGISVKSWKKFDENGILLITITYKDNKEYRINGEKIGFTDNDVKLIQ